MADADTLLPLVYAELRRLAAQRLAAEPAGHTLDATALVHEVYLKLAPASAGFANRSHFLAVAAEAMRRILVDHARSKGRTKRGGDRRREALPDLPAAALPADELLDLDEALTKLRAEDERAADLATLCLFAGLSVDEAGTALGLSRAAAYREWTYARAWLRTALNAGGTMS